MLGEGHQDAWSVALRSWKWILGAPYSVSEVLSVVLQGCSSQPGLLKLVLLIQETEEVWHPLKRIGIQEYYGSGCLYNLPSRDILRKVKT